VLRNQCDTGQARLQGIRGSIRTSRRGRSARV
jgi:hypothetical protein